MITERIVTNEDLARLIKREAEGEVIEQAHKGGVETWCDKPPGMFWNTGMFWYRLKVEPEPFVRYMVWEEDGGEYFFLLEGEARDFAARYGGANVSKLVEEE